MSNEKQTTAVQKPQEHLTLQAQRIDKLAEAAQVAFGQSGGISHALAVGQAMADLRAALTPEIMKPILSLMNSKLGFDTDRNPARPTFNKETKRYEEPKPYPFETVRDCVAEALLRGYNVVGNEFNLIASGFYAAKNGLKRKCETFPGVTDLAILIGVPKNLPGGVIVPSRATWRKNGKGDSIECEIPIKAYEGTGADALIGKAERKLYKRIHDRLSGRVTEDGDAAEETPEIPPERLLQKPNGDAQIVSAASKTDSPPPQEKTASAAMPVEQPMAAGVGAHVQSGADDANILAAQILLGKRPMKEVTPPSLTPQQRIAKGAVEHGVSFDTFRKWAADFDKSADSWATWDEIPIKLANLWLKAPDEALWAEVEKAV